MVQRARQAAGADVNSAVHRARGAGARVPAQRRAQLAASARRLDAADVRGAAGLDRGGEGARRRWAPSLNAGGAAGDRRAARRATSSPAWTRASGRTRARLRHHQLALRSGGDAARQGRRSERGRPVGQAALYAAVDMNSMQWTQGRPAPIFTDRLDAIDLVKQLLAEGAPTRTRASGGRRSSVTTTPAPRSTSAKARRR
mgnify:CR=1 FL=1